MGNYFSIDEELFSYGILSYGYYPTHLVQYKRKSNKTNIEMTQIEPKIT